MFLELGPYRLDLRTPRLMGVLNVTPDSFSDGGRAGTVEAAVARARQMVAEGAHLIDVGGESTRPGATPVDEAEELRRVVPVITALTAELDAPVSIDTSKPAVMRAAVAAGATLINDVRALQGPEALATAASLGVAVCLMHMQGEPGSMQDAPQYTDVLGEVEAFLLARAAAAEAAGIPRAHILLDPGFGFGKTQAHNLALLRGLPRLAAHGYPVLAGLSRKRLIGELTGQPVEGRAVGSAVAAVEAARRGARILRVHDVAATRDALAVATAINTPD
jgi:dihydropteroate synthase